MSFVKHSIDDKKYDDDKNDIDKNSFFQFSSNYGLYYIDKI